jgi:glutathione S-transferase
VATDLPRYMQHLSAALAHNGGPFLTGGGITLADVWWLPRVRYLSAGVATHIPVSCLEVYPEVLAWKERMMTEPKIAAWYSTVPQSK